MFDSRRRYFCRTYIINFPSAPDQNAHVVQKALANHMKYVYKLQLLSLHILYSHIKFPLSHIT
jgi:hypothetical protein